MQAAQTLGASNRQLLLHVVIPAALPALYRDMRILIGWAWTYLVVAELIGEKSGISAFLYQQQRYRHFENVYAGIVMIGVIGLVTDQLLAFVGRFLFPWESGNTALLRWSRGSAARALARRALAAAPTHRRCGRPLIADRPIRSGDHAMPSDDRLELPSYLHHSRRGRGALRRAPRSDRWS